MKEEAYDSESNDDTSPESTEDCVVQSKKTLSNIETLKEYIY